ncbi:hypothetical protein KI387_037933, partial [Taxus chinensis]
LLFYSALATWVVEVVIDEATAGETGMLPPLSLGAARCVLGGDPQPQPATIICQAAGKSWIGEAFWARPTS